MILSIHIAKTAGASFRSRLQDTFGSRLFMDYGDWVGFNTPAANSRRAARTSEMRTRRDELLSNYDLIHGHFIADKYAALFPKTEFVAFFRDPYQQAVSHYEFLRRHPEIDNPGVSLFHEIRPTLQEFIALLPNPQTDFVGSIPIEDFAMVGLTEQFERGVTLFEAVFDRKLAPQAERQNVNPHRSGDAYPIDLSVRQAVDTHRGADIDLYRRACNRFTHLAARYGV